MNHPQESSAVHRLQAYWARSCPALPAAVSAPLFARVLAGWNEPQRAYHTTQHLLESLTLLDEWSSAQDWPVAVALALFFHDLVYDPRRSDNEEMSARLAQQMLAQMQAAPQQVQAITALIDVTRHAATPRTADEKLIVDIDLAILGAAPPRYAQYQAQVRQEYAHVPEALFLRGRLAVLQAFLRAGNGLYHTARGRSAFAAAAARNLTAEVQQLRCAIAAADTPDPDA